MKKKFYARRPGEKKEREMRLNIKMVIKNEEKKERRTGKREGEEMARSTFSACLKEWIGGSRC